MTSEFIELTKQYDQAITLLTTQKQRLIRGVQEVAKHDASYVSLFESIITSTKDDQIAIQCDSYTVPSRMNSNINEGIRNDYSNYIDALKSAHYLHKELKAINRFQEAHDNLLHLMNNKPLDESTKIAVYQLIEYINKQKEQRLWRKLFGISSWDVLVRALDQTYHLIDKKMAPNQTDLTAYSAYMSLLNTVDGKPMEFDSDSASAKVVLPIMPLTPIIGCIKTGLETGFLAGGLLCPTMGIAACIAISLTVLYFIIHIHVRTGLSKKMLQVAQTEQPYADQQYQEQKHSQRCNEYANNINHLTAEHRNNSLIISVIQSIDEMYGSNDLNQSFILLWHLKNALDAKSQPQLSKAIKNLSYFSRKITVSSYFFKPEETQLEKDILALAEHLNTRLNQDCEHQIQSILSTSYGEGMATP